MRIKTKKIFYRKEVLMKALMFALFLMTSGAWAGEEIPADACAGKVGLNSPSLGTIVGVTRVADARMTETLRQTMMILKYKDYEYESGSVTLSDGKVSSTTGQWEAQYVSTLVFVRTGTEESTEHVPNESGVMTLSVRGKLGGDKMAEFCIYRYRSVDKTELEYSTRPR
jgi:hypothetical protein